MTLPSTYGGTKLTFTQIEQVWIANGGAASQAPMMAAIAIAESGGWTGANNPNSSTKSGESATPSPQPGDINWRRNV